jgi:basic amino acid/polyamine antiporter, APA family
VTDGATSLQATEQGRAAPLQRVISRNMLLLLIVGDMVGAGIYALVGEVGGRVGGAIWTSFLLAAVLAIFTAFAYAELVTKYPHAGGAALYVNKAFRRPMLTFAVAFAVMMSGITSAATLSRAFGGDYLGEFFDVPTVGVALAFIAVIAAINIRGMGDSIKVNVLCTVIAVLGLIAIAVIGSAYLLSGEGDPGRALEFSPEGSSVPFAILAGAGLAFYALIGFEDSVNFAEEAREPRRNYPRALFGGLLLAALLYLLVSTIASMAVPTDRLSESSGPLVEVATLGPLSVDGKIFSAVALFAIANTALINMIMASRLVYGMSREGIVPAAFSKVLPGRRTPWVAILFTTTIGAALILTGDLATLADTTVVLLLLVFAGVNVTVMVLRRRPVDHEHFRAPAIFPVLGILVSFGVMTTKEPDIFIRAAVLLGLGVVLWGLNRVLGGERPELNTGRLEAVEHPTDERFSTDGRATPEPVTRNPEA